MAVSLVSGSQGTWSSVTSHSVTKPSGLLSGDLLILVLATIGARPFTVGADWFNLAGTSAAYTEISIANNYQGIAWRYATVADESASSYSFNTSEAALACASMICIRGAATSSPIGAYASATVADDSTPSFANTITPPNADSLIVLAALASSTNTAGTGTASGYAIVTSTPTWTEAFEGGVEGGAEDKILAAAAGVRAAITATGNSSLTWDAADAGTDSSSFLIAISPFVAVGPVNMKSYNTNLSANVKSINTNPIANVKSLNTNV